MTPVDDSAGYCTVSQACRLLQVDRKTLYKLIAADQLPGTIRIFGDYRIPWTAVVHVGRDLGGTSRQTT